MSWPLKESTFQMRGITADGQREPKSHQAEITIREKEIASLQEGPGVLRKSTDAFKKKHQKNINSDNRKRKKLFSKSTSFPSVII